ncbi:unnamed protein product [Protopolystoma xenopodis]|uniref:Band 3 cytoplasmic domain-containing protein n=1 Tax=Protopolystoma xenopodis TaxID=117903 RepID=A0A3S4ZB29_9PLAT|nr:unnamed protein product [Protopolystoma xenopodis]
MRHHSSLHPHLHTHHHHHHHHHHSQQHSRSGSIIRRTQIVFNTDLQACLQPGTEACCVLSGLSNLLRSPLLALVRMQTPTGLLHDGLVEVAVPVRFIFLCLGPTMAATTEVTSGARTSYYTAIARCFAVMAKNLVFCATAFAATDPEELIEASNEFLDASILMPISRNVNPQSLGGMVNQIREFEMDMELRSEMEKATIAAQSYERRSSMPADVKLGHSLASITEEKKLTTSRQNSSPISTGLTSPVTTGAAASAGIVAPSISPTPGDQLLAAMALRRMSRAGILPPSDLVLSSLENVRASAMPLPGTGIYGGFPVSGVGEIGLDGSSVAITGLGLASRGSISMPPTAIAQIDDKLDERSRLTTRQKFLFDFCPPCVQTAKGALPWLQRFPSDFKDAFTKDNLPAVLTCIVFLYFVLLAPAITFGAILSRSYAGGAHFGILSLVSL